MKTPNLRLIRAFRESRLIAFFELSHYSDDDINTLFFEPEKNNKENIIVSSLFFFNMVVFTFSLKEDMMAKILKKQVLFREICIDFLWLYNSIFFSYYSYVSFDDITINNTLFSHSIFLVWTDEAKRNRKWEYITLSNVHFYSFHAENKLLLTNKLTYLKSGEEPYEQIMSLLDAQNISVRQIEKIPNITQKQSRNIYKELIQLWIFVIDKKHTNKKIFFPENFSKFSKENFHKIVR